METGLLNKLTSFTKDEKIAFRKKAIIFSFFLFLSVVFWLMIALSKNYITTINYPIRYTDIPAGRVLVSDTPDYLTLKVSTHGYRIIRHKLSSRYLPITFSVSSFSLRTLSDADTSVYYIQTRFSRDYLARQLSNEFNISDIRPDTLFFRFASIITKKLPVKPDLIMEADRQMIFKGPPVSDPDSILVSGPDYIIDTMQYIYTRQKKLGTLSKSFEGNVDVGKPDFITVKHDRVKVSVGVERITEKVLTVPLEVVNLPDSISVKTFPASVEVNCQVGLSNFPRVTPDVFRLVADFNEVASATGRLSVELIKSPDFVRSIKYSPKNVEFLIEK